MTHRDRQETQAMLHDILSGWRAGYESHIEVTNLALQKIEKHLEKLNGTVASQQKIIDQNLPHNIAHCSQVKNIEELKENMITGKAIRNYIYGAIGIMGALTGILYVIFEILVR